MPRAISIALGLLVILSGAGIAAGAAAQDDPAGSGSSSLSLLRSMTPPPEPTACISRARAKAEQVMLMHTELMVTSLACDVTYGDLNLYQHYGHFTATHGEAILEAQQVLEREFGGGDAGAQAFDQYRLDLGNAEGQRLSEWSIERYCRVRQSRFETLIGARPEQFQAYVTDLAGRVMARQIGCP